MQTTRTIAIAAALVLAGCAGTAPDFDPEKDFGHAWVKDSADYAALTRQVYAVATRDLARFVADSTWSAMPGQTGAAELPPAVILDVDETVINNVNFQVRFERPFTDQKLEMWDREHIAEPVPGVVEFIAAARDAEPVVYPGEPVLPDGIPLGANVVVVADEYGSGTVAGQLAPSGLHEVAVRRQTERAGEVVVHFPREDYMVVRAG